ncbi:MAG: flagellar basal body rod protein FlgC [Bdellovibrionales bacterium RIFOXYB1_FULL_37_110]|nr:MAG: flagellar basal body rod protein FlgC [Bdellovibrionales bacterium RIFOXYA1_FULL_38_20]OFZ48384.1 MAG: flagellar basal body rod protein FlgC [Bdellovibrionales bacterium RIFOXYC1_FULL_37_79]OFZ53905.1 MAG: flagellar basal body rod protein FlgC [Bdellovibrionales bacterium RIFOXYB2_FULL_36_6]OFZ61053.1 MAG: flagellar basal body rod protein FlgC [Bdellovibrionales bacterium RIFOXYB1_FULL_37_110]OFZ65178.1 MAG: flagellar basal body rod protein FlgC [Bdellovibrionales bacterium RIFOXYD1_FUL
MDLLTSLKISSSGLAANRKRMAAISSNIANAQTTKTVEGGPYRPKEVVFGAEPARESFADILEGEINEHAQEVHATEVISSNRPPILKYEPNHPDADEKGYVAYPDINVMKEMAEMIEASRSYEANISALNTSKNMALKGLEIGK